MPKTKVPHYNTQNFTPDKDKQDDIDPCAKFVVDEWDAYDDYWSDTFNKFEKHYDRWKGKPPVRS